MKVFLKNSSVTLQKYGLTAGEYKTSEFCNTAGVYKIVNGVPTFFDTQNWTRSILVPVSRLQSMSVWCTGSSAATVIPGIIYLSSQDINSYIGAEFSSSQTIGKLDSFSVPAGAQYCLLQTSVSYTTNTNKVVIN